MEEVHSLHVAVGIHSPVPVFANLVVMLRGRKREHTQETHTNTPLASVGLDMYRALLSETSVCCGFHLLLSTQSLSCDSEKQQRKAPWSIFFFTAMSFENNI